MRVYLFYNDRGYLVWHIPWSDEDEPIIVEARVCDGEGGGVGPDPEPPQVYEKASVRSH